MGRRSAYNLRGGNLLENPRISARLLFSDGHELAKKIVSLAFRLLEAATEAE
jgi:hypothetical protein